MGASKNSKCMIKIITKWKKILRKILESKGEENKKLL